MTRSWLFCIAALSSLAVLGAPANGQSVRGMVVEESGQGIEGAAIFLVTPEGQRVRGTLSGEGGRFRLHALAPGTYHLGAERVGFRSWRSPPLTLRADQALEQILVLPTEPVSLEGITATGRRRCTLRPETGRETARVWDEARKALDATALAQSDRLVRFDLNQYRRELDVATLGVVSEEVKRKSGRGERPFQSLPVHELVEKGFVHETDSGTVYYGPDAEVLLSDDFLDTHCMRVVEGGEGEKDRIGLAFEPVRGRKLPDIRGTLWLDRRTAELRSLEYRYTGLPRSVSHDHLGGSIEFRRLGSGLWVVDRWSIRMPQVEQVRIAPSRAAGVETPARSETRVRAIREEAGEIVSVRQADGSGEARARAALVGRVRDGSGAPLAHARVFLSGTPYSARTDSAGRFEIAGLPEGRYSASFLHPSLGPLAALVRHETVTLEAGSSARVELRAPSTQEMLTEVCPATKRSDAGQLVTGVVRSPEDSAPVPGARVSVSWSRFGRTGGAGLRETRSELETSTDAQGHFVACGVPAGALLQLRAGTDRRSGPAVRTEVEPGAWAHHTLLTASPGAEIASEAVADGAGAAGAGAAGAGASPFGEVIELEGLTVEARARPNSAHLGGFHERRKRERGHFVTREEFMARNPSHLADILRVVPGVRIRGTSTGLGTTIQMERAAPGLNPTLSCPVTVYLDGVIHELTERGLDEIRPDEIAAMEVYPGASQIPARFKGRGSRCGVLVLWTRTWRG